MCSRNWQAGASLLRDLARQIGINPRTLCRWQRRYGGMQIPEAKRMILLEKENIRLKRIVADLELDKSILKESLAGGKYWTPAQRRRRCDRCRRS